MIETSEFNITKTCPFLDKLCITEDCPSFSINHNSFRKFADRVILLKEEKKLIGTKIVREGWGLIVGWDEKYFPVCQVLSPPQHIHWRYQGNQTGVPVGDTIQKVSKRYKQEWVKLNGWCSSYREVTELPEIQSSTGSANK